MELVLDASPSAEISLNRYDPHLFSKFRPLFETEANPESPLHHFACDSAEADAAVVMENHSEKDVTALRYCWYTTGDDGSEKRHTVSGDSYLVDVFHPVLAGRDRKLITWSRNIDESMLEHVLRGGGFMGSGSTHRPLRAVKSLRFEIDFVLFADGEIAGEDRDRYAAELKCRKPAAEFVAKQIRLAQTEGRDVTPVLSAIAELPHIGNLRHGQGDPLIHWVQRYARDYVHTMSRNASTVNTPRGSPPTPREPPHAAEVLSPSQ